MTGRALFSLFFLISVSPPAVSADWAQWRGGERHGRSPEDAWSSDWPADRGPSTLWKASVGIGFASVALSEGRLLTAGNSAGIDTVWCLHAFTGKVLWKYSYPCLLWDREHAGGPSATPAISDGRVYTLSKEGHLFAFDLRAGSILWQLNIREKFRVPPRPSEPLRDYGYVGSPMVVGDLVVVPVGGKNANTVALDRVTGEKVWASGNDRGTTGAGYATPVPFSFDAREYLAVLSLRDLEILETATGRQVAAFAWATPYGVNSADPVIDGNRIFITSDFGAGCVGLEFNGKSLREVFRHTKVMCKFTSPIAIDGHVYAATTNGIFKCVDLETGRVKWKRRGFRNSSLVAAGKRFLALGEGGDLIAATMTPEGYTELARAKVLDGLCWTPPVLSNGLLYVRNSAGDLVCIDLLR